MDIYSKFFESLVAFLAIITIALSAPVVKSVEDIPSTYRRVRMAHKFGIVAINAAGKVYLTRNMDDVNSIMVLWVYGPRKYRIQGEKSGLNIAMNSRGKVYATRKVTVETLFLYSVLPNSRHVFESSLYKSFFLGFNKQLLPKKGSRTRIWKNDRCYFRIFGPKDRNTIQINSPFYKYFKSAMQG